MAAGVEVFAYRADVSPEEIRVVERIAVEIPSTSNENPVSSIELR